MADNTNTIQSNGNVGNPEPKSKESYMEKTCWISTGEHEVMHTLWVKVCGHTGGRGFCNVRYIQNLPINKDDAIAQAKDYAIKNNYIFKGVEASPHNTRLSASEPYTIFGVTFKTKRDKKNGGRFYVGEATTEFWDAWRKDKESLKLQGFSVTNFKSPYSKNEWWVFYRPIIKIQVI